jgi:hypothetical protein
MSLLPVISWTTGAARAVSCAERVCSRQDKRAVHHGPILSRRDRAAPPARRRGRRGAAAAARARRRRDLALRLTPLQLLESSISILRKVKLYSYRYQNAIANLDSKRSHIFFATTCPCRNIGKDAKLISQLEAERA